MSSVPGRNKIYNMTAFSEGTTAASTDDNLSAFGAPDTYPTCVPLRRGACIYDAFFTINSSTAWTLGTIRIRLVNDGVTIADTSLAASQLQTYLIPNAGASEGFVDLSTLFNLPLCVNKDLNWIGVRSTTDVNWDATTREIDVILKYYEYE